VKVGDLVKNIHWTPLNERIQQVRIHPRQTRQYGIVLEVNIPMCFGGRYSAIKVNWCDTTYGKQATTWVSVGELRVINENR